MFFSSSKPNEEDEKGGEHSGVFWGGDATTSSALPSDKAKSCLGGGITKTEIECEQSVFFQ